MMEHSLSDLNDLYDINSFTDETEYMEDDEHEATMLKLFNEIKDTKEIKHEEIDDTISSDKFAAGFIDNESFVDIESYKSLSSKTKTKKKLSTEKKKKKKKKKDTTTHKQLNRPIPIITRVNSNELIIPQPRASQIEKKKFNNNNNNNNNNDNTPQLNRSHSHNPYNNYNTNYNPPRHNYNLLEEDNKYLLFEDKQYEQYEQYDQYEQYEQYEQYKQYEQYEQYEDLELVEKINHFWEVIDIGSNKKIPFEILKISLRVKSINIEENNWDILLNELTNFQPSKNITLNMFKNFIFNKENNNIYYSNIVNKLRLTIIKGLLNYSSHCNYCSNCFSDHYFDYYFDYSSHKIYQSLINSLLLSLINENLNKTNQWSKLRFNKYKNRFQWRKALKYLLRCHFLYICDNRNVFTFKQFKFALYSKCNIKHKFSYKILPILKLKLKNNKHYIITECSYCEVMLQYIDRYRNSSKTINKLLNIIGFYHQSTHQSNINNKKKQKKKKKKKENINNSIVYVSNDLTDDLNNDLKNDLKLKLLKAKSCNYYMPTNHIRKPYKKKYLNITNINRT